jgi:hypothetical protein
MAAPVPIEVMMATAAGEGRKANQAGRTNEKTKHCQRFLVVRPVALLGTSESGHAASIQNVRRECEGHASRAMKKC